MFSFGQTHKAMSAAMISRKLGHFPISIGTSLAFEVGLGTGTAPEESPTTTNTLTQYESIWINIRTLARNAINAVPTEEREDLDYHDVVEVLDYECKQIDELIHANLPQCREVVFYYSKYEDLEHRLGSLVDLRHPKGPKQLEILELINKGIRSFAKRVNDEVKKHTAPNSLPSQTGVEIFDDLPIPKSRLFNTLIITHIPTDLLAYKQFKKLTLLETHTGKQKPHDEWDSKFYDKAAAPMPFNAATLMIFGDKEMFKPLKQSVRQEIIDIARKRQFTGKTSEERLRLALELSRNHYLRDAVKRMLKAF